MEKREQAFELYKASDGLKPLKEIADEVGVSPGSVRGWKSRYKWDELINKVADKEQRNVTSDTRSVTRDVTEQLDLKPIKQSDRLTEQQKMFCYLYFEYRFNATKAYQEAYQCDYRAAQSNGYRLLRKDYINDELNRIKAELNNRMHATIEDLISEYVKQAFSDITDFVEFGTETEKVPIEAEISDEIDADGMPIIKTEKEVKHSFVRLKDSAQVDGTLIQEVKKGRDGVSVKLYDKQKALEMLFKYLGGDELEQVKLSIEKAKLEAMTGEKEGDGVQDWKSAVIAAANNRVVSDDGN